MRFFIPFAVLAACLVFSPSIHADDNELFSQVAMEFVYTTGDQSKSDQTDTTNEEVLPTRVTGSASLITLLKSAGYEPKKLDSRGVSLEIRSAAWKLQAKIKSDVEADRLTIDMPLAKIDDEANVDQAKLLRLLTVGNGEGDVFFSYNKADGMITASVASAALQMREIDEDGLDEMDKRILEAMVHKFAGGPVGVSSLAVAVGEDASTIEDVYEPYLLQLGFIERTPRGRKVTSGGYRHLGLKYPEDEQEKLV